MRDAVTALEAALSELEHARAELPDDLRTELDGIIEHARSVLASLRASTAERSEAASAPVAAEPRQDVVTAGEDRADATG